MSGNIGMELPRITDFSWNSPIGSWCKFVDEEYMSSPFSDDRDRILLNSKIDPNEHKVITMIMEKFKQEMVDYN